MLALCRRLVEAGHDPARPLHAYRGDVLALAVTSIGLGARIRHDRQLSMLPICQVFRSRNFRSFLRCAGGNERDGASGADVRFHHSARPCLGGGRKRGQHGQALGRLRGGFSTKIQLKTDFGGLPIAFHLTGGEASDSRNFETLLDIGPDINPRAALGDKAYDSKSNRVAARQRGICLAIPYRSNTKDMPAFFPKTLYKAWARIEQAVGKLKRFSVSHFAVRRPRRITARSSRFALGFILIKSVHTG